MHSNVYEQLNFAETNDNTISDTSQSDNSYLNPHLNSYNTNINKTILGYSNSPLNSEQFNATVVYTQQLEHLHCPSGNANQFSQLNYNHNLQQHKSESIYQRHAPYNVSNRQLAQHQATLVPVSSDSSSLANNNANAVNATAAAILSSLSASTYPSTSALCQISTNMNNMYYHPYYSAQQYFHNHQPSNLTNNNHFSQ